MSNGRPTASSENSISFLIPTMPGREGFLKCLTDSLFGQCSAYSSQFVHCMIDSEMGITIGQKRNNMLRAATGKYIAFIDDDDRIADNYVDLIMEGISKGVDCCSLTGLYNPDNAQQQTFIHSIRYDNFFEQDGVLYRCPNHLNTVKRELALQCEFPDWKFSEDTNYAFQLRDKGLLKTEHWIEQPIYTYDFVSNKPTFYR